MRDPRVRLILDTSAVLAYVGESIDVGEPITEIVDEDGVTRGARELSSTESDCVEIFDATALAISIALDAPAPVEPPRVETATPAPAKTTEQKIEEFYGVKQEGDEVLFAARFAEVLDLPVPPRNE